MSVPFTERSNSLSENIDTVNFNSRVGIFEASDSQMFAGYEEIENKSWANGMYQCVDTVQNIVAQIQKQLEDQTQETFVVMCGSGTSGRISFWIETQFNPIFQKLLPQPKFLFHSLSSGGNKAVIKSSEALEDNPQVALQDLKKLLGALFPKRESKKHIILIGITCGMSAPYVISMLNYAMEINACVCEPAAEESLAFENNLTFTPVLMGFNPIALARTNPIENWPWTFKDVASKLEEQAKKQPRGPCFILNPVVGPETITGSTRMKGGSATVMLLATIFMQVQRALAKQPGTVQDSLDTFRDIFRETYAVLKNSNDLEKIATAASESLKRKAHVYYLSDNLNLGLLGLVDGSECPPTFGAHFNDIRGYVGNGWPALFQNHMDIEQNTSDVLQQEIYQFSLADFQRNITVQAGDTLIVLHLATGQDNELSSELNKIVETSSAQTKVLLSWRAKSSGVAPTPAPFFTHSLSVPVKMNDGLFFTALSAKFVLNIISTTAHINKGKVFQNRMIDVSVSNNKLYHRAIGIIASLAAVQPAEAEDLLLRGIYGDETNPDLNQLKNKTAISVHIEYATQRQFVVPTAMLLAFKVFDSTQKARSALEVQPILRNLFDLQHN